MFLRSTVTRGATYSESVCRLASGSQRSVSVRCLLSASSDDEWQRRSHHRAYAYMPVRIVPYDDLGKRSLSSKSKRGGRHFAYKKNEKVRQQEAKKDKKKEKNKNKKAALSEASLSTSSALASSTSETNHSSVSKPASQGVPPALLAPTGSPHVYIARLALMDSVNDETIGTTQDTENTTTNTMKEHDEALDEVQMLFQSYREVPRLFETHQFDHVTPHSLNMEYPTHGRAEVAFLGRSNVGKSSLVNALMRRNLCKTSKSPGRTQLPYYYGLFHKKLVGQDNQTGSGGGGVFKINPSQVTGYVVDLPGYGYGAAPKEVVDGWQAQTQEWLLDRRDAGVLKRLFLLVDARRQEGPSKLDETVIQWAEEAEIPFSIVLTKADRVSMPFVIKQVNDFCIRYSSRTSSSRAQQQGAREATFQSPIVHVTSASSRWGINELLESIEAEFLGLDEDDDDEVVDDDDDDQEDD
jgi:GTP-binding protein